MKAPFPDKLGEQCGPAPEPEVFDQPALRGLLRWAVARQASDILLCSGKRIYINCDGEYLPVLARRLATWELASLLDAIYMRAASARLSGGEDLDFTYEFRLDRAQRLRFRANAVSISNAGGGGNGRGIAITLRSIPGRPPDPGDIDLPEELLAVTDNSRQGLILVTGATGNGKSTLLAACLAHTLRRPPSRHIVSYESPVEFDLSQVDGAVGIAAQSEIPKDLPSFSRAVRNALRRAPDIIFIGEARDRETIAGVVRASQTGHLVYSTVHTGGVAGTIPRMVDEFPAEERHAMAVKLIDCMRLIVHQRLVPATRGGRLALREHLIFTPRLRERLLNGLTQGASLQGLLQDALCEQGQTLYRDAFAKHGDSHIDDEQFALLQKELCHDG